MTEAPTPEPDVVHYHIEELPGNRGSSWLMWSNTAAWSTATDSARPCRWTECGRRLRCPTASPTPARRRPPLSYRLRP